MKIGCGGLSGSPGAALALYRELALLVAENLEHMHFEETENNAQLWAAYGDEELERIHQALLASVKPEIFSLGVRWMVPTMTPAERAGLLAHMPAEVVLGTRPLLGERDWAKLSAALGPVSQ